MNKTVITSLICSVIVFSSSYIYFNVKISVMETRVDSEVKAPMSMALDEIVKDYESGKEELAIKKLKFLEGEWQKYHTSNKLTTEKVGNILLKLSEIELNKEKTEQTTPPDSNPPSSEF